MGNLSPVDWKTLKKAFEELGFQEDRIKGDHLVMSKPGIARPVVIKMVKDVGEDIVRSNMRTAGITRDEFLEILDRVK